jgi:hypothetical protein
MVESSTPGSGGNIPPQEPPASPSERASPRDDAYERLSQALEGLNERIPGEPPQPELQPRTYAKEPELDKAIVALRRATEEAETAEDSLKEETREEDKT